MRTKTILLTAALVAAGVASSMAQSNVYSLNVVGYVNVPIYPNYNLVAQQLDADGVNSINTVLTNGTPDQTQAFEWNGAGFTQLGTFYVAGGNQWYDNNFALVTTPVPPGTALFLYNPGSTGMLTMVGTVDQVTNTFHIQTGYGFYAIDVPVATDLTTNGFPATSGVDQSQYFSYSASGGFSQVGTYYLAGNGWYDNNFSPVHPTPAVGSGFVLYNPSSGATWTQTFTVQ